MKDAMTDGAKRVFKFIKEHERYPKTLRMVDSTNKSHVLTKAQYMGLFEAENIFRIKHGRQPNYVTYNSTASNPLVLDYQDGKMTCCPTSLSMCSQLLFHFKSENQCKKALKTDPKEGTSPDKLVNNAKDLGFKVVVIGRDYKKVVKALDCGYGVIMHIETAKKTRPKCLGYTNNYGHYVCCYKAKNNKYYIADPTKGFKTCKASEIDKAKNGRDLKYYIIKPL